jgi:hypothetical protein
VVVAGLSLLAPWGLLVCASALVPLGALLAVAKLQARATRSIGLSPAPGRAIAPVAAATAAACVALGIAAAQPVVTTSTTRDARTESEVVFVVDVSRSMLASARPGGSTRLERARDGVRQMRLAVPDVPAGISGLTDRLLPFLFPTLDTDVFSETLERSVQADAPPPLDVREVATTFEPLSTLPQDGFFTPGVTNRTCVLVTDGETRSPTAVGASLSGSRGCRLVVVRVGGSGDRIYTSAGKAVAGYRPETSAQDAVARLAQSAGGVAFDEGDVADAAAAVREAAERGPKTSVGSTRTTHALAPYFAGIALVLVLGIVALRLGRSTTRRLPTQLPRHYHSRPEARPRRAG